MLNESKATESGSRARMVVLGANAWFVSVAWPSWSEGSTRAQVVLAVASAASLGLGTWQLARRSWARWLLLVGFPVGLIAHVATRAEQLNHALFDPAVSLLAVLSLAAYAGAAAQCLSRANAARTHHVEALELEPEAPTMRNRLRGAVLTLAGVGTLIVAVLVPRLGGPERWRAHWDDAALEGGLLTAVIGVVLGTTIWASFIGSSLRGEGWTRRRRKRRTAQLLMLASAGAVTYGLLFLR